MKKSFLNVEVINVMAAMRTLLEDEKKVKELPIKLRWALKKNMSALSNTVDDFEAFRQELVEELQNEYFSNDEKSYPAMVEVPGQEEPQEGRKVKEEYLEEYEKRVEELNTRLQELLREENEYEIRTVDLDAFVENLADDTSLTFDDVDMLSFMDKK